MMSGVTIPSWGRARDTSGPLPVSARREPIGAAGTTAPPCAGATPAATLSERGLWNGAHRAERISRPAGPSILSTIDYSTIGLYTQRDATEGAASTTPAPASTPQQLAAREIGG